MNIERLGLLLHKADTVFKRDLNAELKKLRLTHTELAVLMDLYSQKMIGSEESRTVSIIAARLGYDEETLEEVITHMESSDWIVKFNDQVDRRRVDIFLSNKAVSIIDFLREIYNYVEEHAYKGFSKEEIEELEAYLKRVNKNLKV